MREISKMSKAERMEMERSLLQEMAPPTADHPEKPAKVTAPEKALLPPSLSKLGTFKSLQQKERGEDAWGEDLLGNGALLMLTEEEDRVDDMCAQADHGMEVTIMIAGRVQGMESSEFLPRQKMSYRVGFEGGRVVQGVGLAVRVMREGQKSTLRINTPMLGYGEAQQELNGVQIPADSSLEYDIELVAVGTPPAELSPKRQFDIASELAVEGKAQFSEGQWEQAEASYEHALEILERLARKAKHQDEFPVTTSEIHVLRLKCGNNLAIVFLKQGKHEMVLETCDVVLEQDSDNLKALCQKGRVLTMIGGEANLARAEETLQRAGQLHPESMDVARESKTLKKKQSEIKQDEKKLINRMMGAPKPQSEVEVTHTPPRPAVVSKKKGDSVVWTVLLSALVVIGSCAIGCCVQSFVGDSTFT